MLFNLPGMAPVKPLLLDPQITEIMINGHEQVFIERGGRMEQHAPIFHNDQQLRFFIETMIEPTGRSVSASQPMADFRLPDGSRVNVIVPPVVYGGPVVTIRKFTKTLSNINHLIEKGTVSKRMAQLLIAAVQARLNIIFAGATGTGKTTTLNILGQFIGDSERIITIEDTIELDLPKTHVVQLECRTPNVEGGGQIKMANLLKNAFRMRPNRIIVGEIRGDEAVDMLQAISSGHEGCLAVLHAGSPDDAAGRLEMMMLERDLGLPLWAIRKQIASAIDIVVQHEILLDGTRKVTRISEVCPPDAEGETRQLELRNLFEFQQDGIDESGRVIGSFISTGVEPNFISQFARLGVEIPGNLFAKGQG